MIKMSNPTVEIEFKPDSKPRVKIGDVFYRNIAGPFKYKCHVVALLLDEPKPQIVWKYYGKHKQWWHYQIESIWIFNVWLKDERGLNNGN